MKLKIKLEYNKYISVLLIAVILVLVNFIANRHFYRVDLTEDQQYVISDVSKRAVSELDDLLTVKVFFSKKMPSNLVPLSQYVKDILSEYQAYSNGNMSIEYLDPAEDEELKQEVASLGIPEVQMNVMEKDKWQVQNGYLGITLFYGTKHENIPIVNDAQNFEYDFTSSLKRVTAKEIKKVGFLSGHKEHSISRYVSPEDEALKDYAQANQILVKNYDVVNVDITSGNAISDVDTLIVAGPKEQLSERDLYEIDQFIMNGGNAIFLVDQLELKTGLSATPVNSGLDPLLARYGIVVGKDLVLDVSNETVPFSNGSIQFLVPYPYWPKFLNQNFNLENPIVSKLEGVSFAWVSSVSSTDGLPEGVSVDMLLKTTPRGWIQKNDFSIDPNKEFDIAPESRAQFSVMALAKGKFKSYYSGKEVPVAYRENSDGEYEEIEGVTEGRIVKEFPDNDIQIIVIGDSDFMSDSMLRNFPNNLVLFLNAVDYLTLDSDLIEIRSKVITERPLEELSEQKKSIVKFVGVLAVPLLIISYGIFRTFLRRKMKKRMIVS